MLELKHTENLTLVITNSSNLIWMSYGAYSRFVGKHEATIRKRANSEEYSDQIYSGGIKGQNYKLIPINICLQWLLKDNPAKINILVDEVYALTGIQLKFPDFTKNKVVINKKQNYTPKGLIYLFESSLGLLKLGFTKNVKQRLNDLKRWEGELTILDVVEGTIYKEKEIHKILHTTGDFYGDEWYPLSRKQEICDILSGLSY
jgi:hypothetical protein